jgi:CheY-like chemotaxis protein
VCRTCLIAEHDPWEMALLTLHAERLGLRVTQAYEGQDVLSLARSTRPDVILLERDLLGSSTTSDISQGLKGDAITCHIPVVLLVRSPGLIDPETALAAAYLQKPATFDTFVSALRCVGL